MSKAGSDQYLALITSFNGTSEDAIHSYRFCPQEGTWELLSSTESPNPFYLAVNSKQTHLYAIVEPGTFGSGPHGEVAAFEIDHTTGVLTELNRVSGDGLGTCYVAVTPNDRTVLFANYSSGSVGSIAIEESGCLGALCSFHQHTGSSVNPERQMRAHAHSFIPSPDGAFAFAADLGIDQIRIYGVADDGSLLPNEQPFLRTAPGTGPRHVRFHPNGQDFYIINELLSTLTHCQYDSDRGLLFEAETIPTLPESFSEVNHTADLQITPNGRFLYGSNRGHDSVAAYAIQDDGSLRLLDIVASGGEQPQNLTITPDGRYLVVANMTGGKVTLFEIGDDGGLTAQENSLTTPGPSSIELIPLG